MKINPLGIQTYQELTRRETSTPRAGNETSPTPERVAIEPKQSATRSRLAVSAPTGSYAEFLSTEERQALDQLFAKFRGHERFASDNSDDRSADGQVGNWIDVKA
jgi:hypothetical protein